MCVRDGQESQWEGGCRAFPWLGALLLAEGVALLPCGSTVWLAGSGTYMVGSSAVARGSLGAASPLRRTSCHGHGCVRLTGASTHSCSARQEVRRRFCPS